MATTAQEVFERAMSIMDELNDSGQADTSDTAEYKNRTLAILNLLGGELYPKSDTYEIDTAGERPIMRAIESFDDYIDLDDYCCRTVLPYGLVDHLWLDENPSGASFCQQRYEDLKSDLGKGLPKVSEDIVDVYGPCGGISPYNEFGMWW